MADAWNRGARDESVRSPLQGGERSGDRGTDGDRRGRADGSGRRRADRHIRLGVSHPSDDPARHRVFEVRAAYSEAAGGWVAQVGEQNTNEQLQGWGAWLKDGGRERSFPTAAACLGDAVALIVAMVDREADDGP
jgi:hypothetical protein